MTTSHGAGIAALILVAIILPLVLLGACSVAPVVRPVVDPDASSQSRVLDMPRTKAFTLAVKAVKGMGYQVLLRVPAAGTIKTDAKGIPIQDNCDCGSWEGSPVGGMAGSSLQIKVSQLGPGKSRVTVWGYFATKFQGRNLYGKVVREEAYRCASLGAVEEKYLNVLSMLTRK